MNKHIYILLTTLLIIIPTLHSCKGNESNDSEEYYEDAEEVTVNEEAPEYIPEDKEISFPKTGRSIEDFIPRSSKYEVIRELKMDLNKDGLEDLVLLLFHKNDPDASRPVLILLQQEDNTYILDAMSRVAMLSKYADDNESFDFDILQNEDSKKLQIYAKVYGGYFSAEYEYIDNQLIATTIDLSISAAGFFHGVTYTPLTGDVSTEESSHNWQTGEQDETSNSYTLKPRTFRFESDNPRDTEITINAG
ncbi:hypothetical protein [Myroides sp. N17-2]|uniref:hypothetical protein n=1 Tax=Myroides sp. N17-2 TaxID=2030799 RepID=UPI000EFD1D14|nr:hypothetical protein [Myroides sp. N17-2]